jgi:sugar transferase (PEP-CTERM/EpsH1 system associated)
MRILLTLPRPLFPPDTGGKIRSKNIFARLAHRAEIHAVSFADPLRDAAAISEMDAMFASYTPVFWQEASRRSARFYTELLANQFSSLPYFLAKCDRATFRRTIEQLVARKPFDLVFCDFLHTAVPLRQVTFRPRVVFEHNVEFLLRKRKWEMEQHPLKKLVFGAEWRKARTAEGKVCRSFDHVLTVSTDDENTMRQEFGVENVSTLPTGVDTDFFTPVQQESKPGHLVFVGSMDWDPNEDGIVWFIREVYPRIRQAMPHTTLSIVGRNPSPRLRAFAATDPAIEITGRVPDVRSHVAKAEVVIVPLRVGGGTRIKIPEAMAMAKPVVSTTIGAEGLPFRHRDEILLADEPQEFAQAVSELLNNAPLRKSIGDIARQTVVGKHGWNAVVDKLEQILSQVVGDGRQAVAA